MRLQIFGARGSTPVSGAQFMRYGGHTTCFAMELAGGEYLVIDGGSGLAEFEVALGPSARALHATFLFTHLHWDHIQGLPFFSPVYSQDARLRFVGGEPVGMTLQRALEDAIRPPWFPVALGAASATTSYEGTAGPRLQLSEVEVRGVALHHPGGVIGYRITSEGRSLVVATDVEHGDPESDAALLALAHGASVLIHDAQYTPDEWATARTGWGHSTWEHATAVALEAGVERLVLTSHDPARSDEGVDAILAAARERFPATDAAYEGMTVEW